MTGFRRIVRFVAICALLLAIGLAAWVAWRWNDRPSLAPYASSVLPPAPSELGAPRLIFLGVSSVLLSDGETHILTDGFFSRPALAKVLFQRIAPDTERIDEALRRIGNPRLSAVLALHSHYDHAMDAGVVTARTGAVLVGSASTWQVGSGAGLPDSRMRLVRGGERLQFGRFEIEVIRSAHLPHALSMGEIEAPLVPPVRASAYKEGGSFQLLVRHGNRSLLLVGSAGFVPGALSGRQADVVLLGVGGLGREDPDYRQRYWDETARAVGARRVIPIHWDDFSRPLTDELLPMPRLLDDFDTTMQFLRARTGESKSDLRLAPAWVSVDPWQGL